MLRPIYILSIFCSLFILFQVSRVAAQDFPADTLTVVNDTLQPDTLVNDTLAVDTTTVGQKDALEARVDYQSADSIVLEGKNIKLYKNGEVYYQDIELKANYIDFNMDVKEVYAMAFPDSAGNPAGPPVFRQGTDEFQSKTMRYNFDTKKGYITEVYTEQTEGFLHSRQTKRLADGQVNIKGGRYTTCELEHPHFYVGMTKAIVIPNEKIVSGPAYLVVEDIPLPIILPFGFFPNTKEKAMSGILIPTYGEERLRGYYLRNGGFYWAINDYMDARITGDIYSRGSWGLQNDFTYRKRYSFSGRLSGSYFINKSGEEGINETQSRDFRIVWSHAQDQKANPYSTFSANVNYSTMSYDRNQSYNLNERLTNTKSSSISYQKRWPDSPFNFSASLNHSQNSRTNSVNMSLPNASLSMSRIYPFRKKVRTGPMKWYENITLSYTSTLQNNLRTTDSLLLDTKLTDFENGYQHRIPLNFNFKITRSLTLNPNVQYTGNIYTKYINRYFDPQAVGNDGEMGHIVTDTIQGLRYAHAWVPSFSLPLSPKVYGMYTFDHGRVLAMRHVMSPSATLSLTPDMSGLVPDYYKSVRNIETGEVYLDENGEEVEYSEFEGSIYGTPVLNGRSGSVNLSLRNNLEIKRLAKNDTIDETEKISILDNFDFSTNYNIFAEKKWSDLRFTGRTSFFKKKLNLNFNAGWSPYALDEQGSSTNIYEWKANNRILRLTNVGASMGMSFRSGAGKRNTGTGDEPDEQVDAFGQTDEAFYQSPIGSPSQQYVDFDIPWSVRVNYNFTYTPPTPRRAEDILQTFRLNGDFSLTENWKVTYSSGFDFERLKITATSLSIHRDLHCWEMSFSAQPFGDRAFYTFNIKVKAQMLQDLKYDKRWDWRDR